MSINHLKLSFLEPPAILEIAKESIMPYNLNTRAGIHKFGYYFQKVTRISLLLSQLFPCISCQS